MVLVVGRSHGFTFEGATERVVQILTWRWSNILLDILLLELIILLLKIISDSLLKSFFFHLVPCLLLIFLHLLLSDLCLEFSLHLGSLLFLLLHHNILFVSPAEYVALPFQLNVEAPFGNTTSSHDCWEIVLGLMGRVDRIGWCCTLLVGRLIGRTVLYRLLGMSHDNWLLSTIVVCVNEILD